MLAAAKTFEIEVKPLSIEEQEKLEEQQLENLIKKLNRKTTSSEDLTDDEEGGLRSLNSDYPCVIDENFLAQNVKKFDEKLKLMILSQDFETKRELVNKFTNSVAGENLALDIQKVVTKINKTNVQLEIFDTDMSLSSNSMLSIYCKLSQGFIIISNELSSDMTFIINQIKTIREIQKTNSHILLMIKGEYKEELENFAKENEIEVMFYNLDSFSIENKNFEQFLSEAFTA